MKRITWLAGVLWTLVVSSSAQSLSADKIIGIWLTEDKDLKIETFKSGNTYNLKAVLKSTDTLETRGYKGVPMMGKTFKWTRQQ
ncbi:DUF2147 domain-containing protein [Xanthocytophaga agilis]|uniref:DUF2147 domain-containing protein n=1 Tax=Xanthocytophaga agilis TaxID=3048010 RepID=A0AAE3UFU9_9BACT|nr:DUF2147 domain-containing protein [Xanthocytophaga agilis]MDJ1501692.1 DUF2147 domain-containing protein [Xanthocytophaga agilis]